MSYTEIRQAGDNQFTTVWASKEAKAAMEERIGHPLAGRFISGVESQPKPWTYVGEMQHGAPYCEGATCTR